MFRYLIFCTLCVFASQTSLGAKEPLEKSEAVKLVDKTMTHMKIGCPEKNDIVCNLKIHNIQEATKQLVHGYLYDIKFNVMYDKKVSTMDMQLWHQTETNVYTLHKWILDGRDLITNVVTLK